MHVFAAIKEKEDLGPVYSYWRLRIMISMMVGYAGFYLVRQNFSMIIPYLQSDLGYSKTQIGGIITLASLIYGFGKGINGLISDKSDARYFMALGLFLSSLMNIFMGFSSLLTSLMIVWSLSSAFQSMGWGPCARLLTHWFSPKEIATKWSIWNMSQQIGAAFVLIISPYLINNFGWRYVFFIPGCIGIFISIFLLISLRDTPASLGLPSIEEHHGLNVIANDDKISIKDVLFKYVLNNKYVWYVSFANFFLYIVRMSVFYWGPTFLQEFKGISLKNSGAQAAIFDIAGMFGGILAGFLSDKVFNGYRGRVGAIFMFLLTFFVVSLFLIPSKMIFPHFLVMACIGFLLSGPQILVGVASADFSSKKAAGTASGLTGVFGYIGTSITGVGIGCLVDNYGWGSAFVFITLSCILASLFFALTWNRRSKVLD